MVQEPKGVDSGKKRTAYRDSPDFCPSVILIGSLLIRKYIPSFFFGRFYRGILPVLSEYLAKKVLYRGFFVLFWGPILAGRFVLSGRFMFMVNFMRCGRFMSSGRFVPPVKFMLPWVPVNPE
jgi:hypothetical protein